MKITLALKTIITPEFQKAFKALGEDPIAITDRFRIAQTTPILIAAIGSYEEARIALLTRLGEPESVILRRKQANRADAKIISPDDAYVAKRLEELQGGAEDRQAIDNEKKEVLAEFIAEHEKLLNEQVELALTKKVVLSKDSRLNANQITCLMDVVAIPEE